MEKHVSPVSFPQRLLQLHLPLMRLQPRWRQHRVRLLQLNVYYDCDYVGISNAEGESYHVRKLKYQRASLCRAHLLHITVPPSTSLPSTTSSFASTDLPTTEPLPSTVSPESNPTTPLWLRTRLRNSNQCFRYAYGTFTGNITVVGRWECAGSFKLCCIPLSLFHEPLYRSHGVAV